MPISGGGAAHGELAQAGLDLLLQRTDRFLLSALGRVRSGHSLVALVTAGLDVTHFLLKDVGRRFRRPLAAARRMIGR